MKEKTLKGWPFEPFGGDLEPSGESSGGGAGPPT